MEPIFLRLDEVLEIHRDQIEHYGGTLGIRDQGLLQSALAQPSVSFGGSYLHADLYEMAAAYLFHIVQNHPFLDGNKRVGAVSAVVFLAMNDIELTAKEEKYEEVVLAAAKGKASKEEIAEFFRGNTQKG
ncbi:MAG: type II toxin-antitoxin system death-on-curing family toxin [Bdellovibrionota bacterium]